jgi:hypothetical protein
MNDSYIKQEHPDYTANAAMWRRYRDLYAGGERLRQNAAEYLVARQREPQDVYRERLNRVFYENYIGSIIDWYTATLVRKEPVVEFQGASEPAKNFFNQFLHDCDLRGTTATQFFREQLTELLVSGKSWYSVDFPQQGGPALTRAEEDALGRSRAYLTAYSADEVINWSRDQKGELEWAVIRTTCLKQDSVQTLGWVKERRWIYYDRERYEIHVEVEGEKSKQVRLVAEGQHGFAAIKKVPLFELKISPGLWLMNKVALLQLEHFNKSNALGWALTMGLFAMPVIYSDREFQQTMGESYYVQLGAQDRFGWTEPEGKVFQIAADNLERLKDEIYRVSYLMQQAGGGGAHQSGLSKQWDFSVTAEILRAYGDLLKDSLGNVLGAIAAARQDQCEIDVSGLDEFDIADFTTEVSGAQALLGLGIDSPTLKRQVRKRVALKYLCDARQEIKNRIVEEIDANPNQ